MSLSKTSKHGLPSVRHTAFFETKSAEQVRREDSHRPPNMARNQRELPVVLAVAERREAILARIWPQIERQKQARCPQGIKIDVQGALNRGGYCEGSFLGALTPHKT
jgi:hypothetical protein